MRFEKIPGQQLEHLEHLFWCTWHGAPKTRKEFAVLEGKIFLLSALLRGWVWATLRVWECVLVACRAQAISPGVRRHTRVRVPLMERGMLRPWLLR